MGSRNGTFVNNIKIKPYEEAQLQRGDCVSFGDVSDTKEIPGSHVENQCSTIKLVINHIIYH